MRYKTRATKPVAVRKLPHGTPENTICMALTKVQTASPTTD